MTNTLYIEYASQEAIDPTYGKLAVLSWTTPANFQDDGLEQQVIQITSGTANPSATPYATFPDVTTAFAYYQTAMCSALITFMNSLYGVTYYTAYDAEPVDSATNAAVAGKSNKSSFANITALTAHGIANASAASNPGLATNFNLVSGLLGIANGLNDANTAQNDLATKYNDLEGKFNTLLTYATTLETKINSIITAGAA